MKTIIFVFLLILSLHAQSECVILLHGLARSDNSMNKMEARLTREGFNVINVKYPSRKDKIDVLAEQAVTPALTKCSPHEKVNFVTHSLGGILVRQYLSQHDVQRLKRVVMLGPPNKGSEVVDKLGGVPGFRFINGEAGMQLGTGETSVPSELGKAVFDVGIIAGNKSINWILSSLIPGVDDGKVSVERTKLEGMNDHIEMPVAHPFLMKNRKAIAQVVYYLKHGTFQDNDALNSDQENSL